MCSLTRVNMPLYVVHVLQYRSLQSCFLQFLDRSKQPCSLLCASMLCTSETCTPWIIKLNSRLESSCAMLGTHKMFLQWCRDELVLSFIFFPRLVSWDKTRLRKGTTAETQTCVSTKLSCKSKDAETLVSFTPDAMPSVIRSSMALNNRYKRNYLLSTSSL